MPSRAARRSRPPSLIRGHRAAAVVLFLSVVSSGIRGFCLRGLARARPRQGRSLPRLPFATPCAAPRHCAVRPATFERAAIARGSRSPRSRALCRTSPTRRKDRHMSKTTTAPSHRIYAVTKNGTRAGYQQRIGAIWPHADGEGFGVRLDHLPLKAPRSSPASRVRSTSRPTARQPGDGRAATQASALSPQLLMRGLCASRLRSPSISCAAIRHDGLPKSGRPIEPRTTGTMSASTWAGGADDLHRRRCLANTAATSSSVAKRPSRAAWRPCFVRGIRSNGGAHARRSAGASHPTGCARAHAPARGMW